MNNQIAKEVLTSNNEELKSIWIEQMAKGYAEMGELNLQITNEMDHLEAESHSTIENFLK